MNSSSAVCFLAFFLSSVIIGCAPSAQMPAANGKTMSPKEKDDWVVELRPENSFEVSRRHKVSLDGKIRDVYVDFKDGSSGIKHLDEYGVVKSLEVDVKQIGYQGIAKADINEDRSITSISVFDKKINSPIYEIKEENNQVIIKFYENGKCRAVAEIPELGNYAHWTFYQPDGVTLQAKFDLRDNFTPSAQPNRCNSDEQGFLNYNNICIYDAHGHLVHEQKCRDDKAPSSGEWNYRCQTYNSKGALTHRATLYANSYSNTLRGNLEKLDTNFKFPVLYSEKWISQPGWLLDFSQLEPVFQIKDPDTASAINNFWNVLHLRNNICQGRNCYLFYLQSMLSN